jgi:serine/threonine protein kinase/tetratricopeptide (TPR) repeat protein
MNERDIFVAALQKESPTERQAYLDEVCCGDAAIRQRVEALLELYCRAGGLLECLPSARLAPTADEASVNELLGAVIGPYKLVQKLGEGGMGSVYLAEQEEPFKRRVALKLIKPGMDSRQVIRRFEAERQALALMEHNSIAKVLDAGTTPEGHPYFVMELVKGIPITKYCDELHLSLHERLELLLPVCQALQHAHQKGIIHRDVKPSNVLVTVQDGQPVPKVIDFGVAKALHSPLTEQSPFTEFGQVVGTLEYMSPEQAELSALDVDTRADVYALGVLLYELLTGTTPLDRRRLKQAAHTEMLRIIKEEEPPKPSTRLSESQESLASVAARRRTEPATLTKELRGDLDWITMKCLEKDRTRRYPTASGLARDIERHLHDEPVEASPPRAGYRLRKFVRRNRGAVVATAIILLLLVGGIIGTTVGLLREAERAEGERQAKLEAQQAAAAERRAKEESQMRLGQVQKGADLLAAIFRNLDPRAEEREGKPLRAILGERLNQAAAQLEGKAIGDPLTVARLQNQLGASLDGLGQSELAIAVLNKAFQTRTRLLGPDHADTLTTQNDLAEVYYAAGRYPEAIRLYERVRDQQFAKLGPDHADTVVTLGNLADAYRSAGRFTEAIPLLEQVRDTRSKTLGPDHPHTLITMGNLARTYRDAGRFAEAIALTERVRDRFSATLGPDHPYTLTTLNNLAFTYNVAGKLPEAIRLYEEVRDRRIATLGADHPETLTTMNNLAFNYDAAGQVDRAEVMLREVLANRVKKEGRDALNTAMALHSLGHVLVKQHKYAEAEGMLRDCLSIRTHKLPDDWLTCSTRSVLGDALLGQKKYGEAEALLQQGYEGISTRQEKIPAGEKRQVTETLERLVRLYQTTDQKEKADLWRKRLEEANAKKKP